MVGDLTVATDLSPLYDKDMIVTRTIPYSYVFYPTKGQYAVYYIELNSTYI